MLSIELYTAQMPQIYADFAFAIDDSHWRKQSASVRQQIKMNRFLEAHLLQENDIVLQLEHIRGLVAKYGGIPLDQLNDHSVYPAFSFATQVLSVLKGASATFAEQLRRRVHGAFKNPDDLRALRVELSAATHFSRRGRRISWPEMTGSGTFDLLVEDVGENGLEIECKSISEDKGRKIHKREVLDFYGCIFPFLKATREGLRSGLFAVLTLPGRLPNALRERNTLAKEFSACIFSGKNTTLQDGTQIRIGDFELSSLSTRPAANEITEEFRSELNAITGTNNRQTMVLGCKGGGLLAITVQSAADDSMLESMFKTLKDSANRQFSMTRGGMFFVGLNGLNGSQLLSVAGQDQDPTENPTALRVGVSKFLSSTGRDHIVGVGFVSESALKPVQDGLVESGGTAYYFPKRESPLWSDDFSGLFKW